MNGDGTLDVIVPVEDRNDIVEVALIRPELSFVRREPIKIGVGFTEPNLSDVNGDNALDLVAVGKMASFEGSLVDDLLFALGDGHGGFERGQALTISTPSTGARRPIHELLVADFDKSGTPDVLAFFSAERRATIPLVSDPGNCLR